MKSGAGSINGSVATVSPIIDIHTHCVTRTGDDPFGVAETLRGIPAGKHAVTNYRGLPAVSYREMSDFDLQQEICAKAGVTGRISPAARACSQLPYSDRTSNSSAGKMAVEQPNA